jgi:cell division septum initiation protein DivIVA
MPTPIHLPDIPDTERTALVEQLVELIEALAEDNQRQAQTIQQLRDEIKVLKGEKAKPQFKPSGMEGKCDPDAPDNAAGKRQGKRPGSAKRHKTAQLMIHEECPIPPREPPPAGARF